MFQNVPKCSKKLFTTLERPEFVSFFHLISSSPLHLPPLTPPPPCLRPILTGVVFADFGAFQNLGIREMIPGENPDWLMERRQMIGPSAVIPGPAPSDPEIQSKLAS